MPIPEDPEPEESRHPTDFTPNLPAKELERRLKMAAEEVNTW